MNYKIDVYGTNWCVHCTRLKEWIESKNISYVFKNIELPEIEEELQGYVVNGIPFVKFTEVTTKEIKTVTGFDLKAILKIIS